MDMRAAILSLFSSLWLGLAASGASAQAPEADKPDAEALPPNAIVLSEEQWEAMQSPSADVLAAVEKLDRGVPTPGGSGRGVQLGENALATQLSWRARRDQYWRSAANHLHRSFEDEGDRLAAGHLVGLRMRAVDEDNTAWLKGIIAEHGGWPKVSDVGPRVASQLWLLAQHADRDLEFQKEVLALMEPLAKTGEADMSEYAYLYDRVAVGEGRPQRYGTQGSCVEPGAAWAPREIEDPDRVDEFRAAANLGPLADYIAQFKSGGRCG